MAAENDFADKVASLCCEKFSKLGKTGKPNDNEFILLSCFVELDASANHAMRVVSLGTGSKCIGRSKLPTDGTVLHDSHAETVARRAFKLYLLHQIENCIDNKASIFINRTNGKLILKDGLSYHFYTSQTPCGDASIIPMTDNEKHSGLQPPASKKLKIHNSEGLTGDVGEPCVAISDIHRTGAKVAEGECNDERSSENYHTVGVLRTKPGRGDRTLSHCCSDKMLKWTLLGVQGALVMRFIEDPIYVSSIVVGHGPFREDIFFRALYHRFQRPLTYITFPRKFCFRLPNVLQANVSLTCGKVAYAHPSPTSIIWSDTQVHEVNHECAVNGRKLGVTKKDRHSAKGNVSVCRQEMAKFVVRLLKKQKSRGPSEYTIDFDDMSYYDLKKDSSGYHDFWCLLKHKVLTNWTIKPEFAKSFKVK